MLNECDKERSGRDSLKKDSNRNVLKLFEKRTNDEIQAMINEIDPRNTNIEVRNTTRYSKDFEDGIASLTQLNCNNDCSISEESNGNEKI